MAKETCFKGLTNSSPGTVVIFDGSNSSELADHTDVDEVFRLVVLAEEEEALFP